MKNQIENRLDNIKRYGGVALKKSRINILDYPWKDDDREWFKKNPMRSHRTRMPFIGESDKESAKAPAGHIFIILIRQVEPGSRVRVGFYLNADWLPVPDDEAIAHTIFEIATHNEQIPSNGKEMNALITKYSAISS